MSKSPTQVVIIDDDLEQDDSVIVELSELYSKVVLCETPEKGMSYISENLDNDMVVILDIDFGGLPLSGHDVLNSIREKSFLIPVIIWSSKENSPFSDLINNKAYAFVKRAEKEKLFEAVSAADSSIKTSLTGAIEDWISTHEEKDLEKPFLVMADGKAFTLREILSEIRLQTEFGKKIKKDITVLTIDLLMNKKEKLNG